MNNLRHGEPPEDVTLPAVLAVLSLSGLVACWAVLVRRRQPQAGGPAVALTPAAAIFVVGMLLGFAVAYPEAPKPSVAEPSWPSNPATPPMPPPRSRRPPVR